MDEGKSTAIRDILSRKLAIACQITQRRYASCTATFVMSVGDRRWMLCDCSTICFYPIRRWNSSRSYSKSHITPHMPVSSMVLGCGGNLYFERWKTHGHNHQFCQSGQSRSRSWQITQSPIARTWESALKQCTVMVIVEDRSATLKTV